MASSSQAEITRNTIWIYEMPSISIDFFVQMMNQTWFFRQLNPVSRPRKLEKSCSMLSGSFSDAGSGFSRAGKWDIFGSVNRTLLILLSSDTPFCRSLLIGIISLNQRWSMSLLYPLVIKHSYWRWLFIVSFPSTDDCV